MKKFSANPIQAMRQFFVCTFLVYSCGVSAAIEKDTSSAILEELIEIMDETSKEKVIPDTYGQKICELISRIDLSKLDGDEGGYNIEMYLVKDGLDVDGPALRWSISRRENIFWQRTIHVEVATEGEGCSSWIRLYGF